MEERGKIIVIEGTDCSGKETQSKKLIERLNNDGYKTKLISFPCYESPTGKIVGGPYLGKPEIGESYFGEEALRLDPKITSLYYAADRLYNMTKVNEYLDDGYIVILDRYVTSNLAHQGGKIADSRERMEIYNWIDKLEYGLLGLPIPDKTIFLHVPFIYAKELKKNRGSLDIHEKSDEHLKNAERSYLELAAIYNWDTIECIENGKLRSIEDISNEVYDNVFPVIKRKNRIKRIAL